jgi:acetyl-CoA acetyltransferase
MLFNHEIISDFYQGDLIRTENSEIVADRLTASAGIAPKDTDVAMIYDNFTPQVLRQLEGFKYCGIGEANDYIKDGNLELDGKTPLSPNGGLMGEGYIHGMNNITEGVRQMRGSAANQIKNAKTAMLASGVAGAIIGV